MVHLFYSVLLLLLIILLFWHESHHGWFLICSQHGWGIRVAVLPLNLDPEDSFLGIKEM